MAVIAYNKCHSIARHWHAFLPQIIVLFFNLNSKQHFSRGCKSKWKAGWIRNLISLHRLHTSTPPRAQTFKSKTRQALQATVGHVTRPHPQPPHTLLGKPERHYQWQWGTWAQVLPAVCHRSPLRQWWPSCYRFPHVCLSTFYCRFCDCNQSPQAAKGNWLKREMDRKYTKQGIKKRNSRLVSYLRTAEPGRVNECECLSGGKWASTLKYEHTVYSLNRGLVLIFNNNKKAGGCGVVQAWHWCHTASLICQQSVLFFSESDVRRVLQS